ncbi:sigma-54-dependent Fis family transcriptional regulator [Sporosarcina sp. P29]|uniref:sigma-54-dependent Fis family transcriptional regulator n=1 Tax=Sporosarcina sp. P29 TaxID=2048252 RepID=UPI000C16D8A7|nr:sigma-54-dependent Fis family transcriptional regulator [Sporosarcina sp. P29]PIC97916.1 hypothetical protein CSV68_15935 [Sporosarcina sp. P29]
MLPIRVRQLASSKFIKVSNEATAKEVMKLFLNRKQDIACVYKNEHFLGIVTKYSLYRLLLENEAFDAVIEPVIIKNVVTLNENDYLIYGKKLLIEKNVAHAVVLNEAGHVTGILATAEVISGLITDTKSSANQLSSLVNSLEDGIISVNLEMRITSVNTAAVTIIEIQKDELLNLSILDISHTLFKNLKDSITTKNSFVKKVHFSKATTIATFIPIIEWDVVIGAIVVLKEITELEKIAKELKITKSIEKTLDSALELSYDGVLITDSEGIITRANHGILSLLGYQSTKEVINQQIQTLLPEIPADKSILHNESIAGELLQIKGQQAILSQMPIIEEGKNIGAIFKFIFKQLEDWKDLLQQMERLETEISYYRGELLKVSLENNPFGLIISKNKQINSLKNDAYTAAQSFSNILLTGESGTGKELFAAGIHQASERPGAFITVNCGAIPEELLESEFFGYADGAFTGAKKGGKLGKFELAKSGTLFLDEIGDMPLSLQVKILRVLQEKEFEAVGGIKTIQTDVRILAATNKDLLAMVQDGSFRADLYYRLHVIQLHIPPLRDRSEDISLLSEFFINKFKSKTYKQINGITNEALEKLAQHKWPGNVRELENVLERAFHFTTSNWINADNIHLDQSRIQLKELPQQEVLQSPSQSNVFNRKELINNTEKSLLIDALTKTDGNRTKAAEMLGISRSSLYYKIEKFQIKEKSSFKINE